MSEEPFKLLNIFTDKTVGIAFAAAFALWAWMLNSMSDKILQSQEETQRKLLSIEQQMVADRITTAANHTEFREQIRQNTRRVDKIELTLENHRGSKP